MTAPSHRPRALPLRFVYVGPLGPGETCRYRMQALEQLGHRIVGVDTSTPGRRGLARAAHAVRRRLLAPRDDTRVNERMVEASTRGADVVWVDKGLVVRPETLQRIRDRLPEAVLVSYSPDDMLNPHNRSTAYVRSIPVYDLHVTTKSFNVAELLAAGARNAVMVDNGYAEDVHRPVALSTSQRAQLGGPVGCVAFWEEERERSVTHLAAQGIPVRVWGPWPRRRYHPLLRVEGVRAWAGDYARVICSFDVNLAFLRKVNRDLQTTRSVEVPACGAFMLAERSDEHLRLFEEGREAEFFASDDELLDKVRFYLAHPGVRARIAAAGRERCVRSGYGYRNRMADVLEHVRRIRGA